MEPKLVIPTDPVQPFAGDWPRLLKIISIIMLLFSLAQLLAIGIYIYRMLRLATSPDTIITTIRDSGEAFTISTVLLVGLADIFMAYGAVRLYRRRAASLLILGLWLWLLVLAAG